jgi:chemosensory pili system protein ChpA (sensor histidine kinase/response regulator)
VMPREKTDTRSVALVVDDSITVRRVTQRLLERNGMRVLTARDGVDAMEMLQEHTPDIILLDIEMPRMDGYEVAAQVRADARLSGIPIIMITSRVGEKHRARAIEIGVDDYLGKPYQEAQLLEAIEPLIARRREAHLREAN